MSAADNKQLMREIFARIAVGDGRSFVEHLAEDVTMTVTGDYSWSQTFTGKASVLKDLYRYVGSLMAEPGKTIPFRMLADEDWVIVEARGQMLTKPGVAYENQYCLLYRIEAGKIREIREYQDSNLCERVLGPYPNVEHA
jgi:hypothetical protein